MKFSNVNYSLMGGIYLPITSYKNNSVSDYLLRYSDYSFSVQPISFGFFFNKKIGVEVVYQPCGSINKNDRSNQMEKYVEDAYGSNYFIRKNKYSNLSYNEPIHRLFLGFVVNKQINKFIFQPRLSIGITSFTENSINYEIKEKNSNKSYLLSYRADDHSIDRFTITSGLSVSYQLYKSIYFSTCTSISHFKPQVNFTEELEDLFSQQKTEVSRTHYTKSIWNIGINTGFTIILKKRNYDFKKSK